MRLENSRGKFDLQARQLKSLLVYFIDLRKQTLSSNFSSIKRLSLKRDIQREHKNLKNLLLRLKKAYDIRVKDLVTKLAEALPLTDLVIEFRDGDLSVKKVKG